MDAFRIKEVLKSRYLLYLAWSANNGFGKSGMRLPRVLKGVGVFWMQGRWHEGEP